MSVFRDEYPVLGSNSTVEELFSIDGSNKLKAPGVVGAPNGKVTGIWVESFPGFNPTANSIANSALFIAPYPVRLLAAYARYTTASGVASSAVQIEKTPSGTAIGSGTALLTAPGLPLNSAANTNVNATLNSTLNSNNFVTAAGDAFSALWTANTNALVNAVVVLALEKA